MKYAFYSIWLPVHHPKHQILDRPSFPGETRGLMDPYQFTKIQVVRPYTFCTAPTSLVSCGSLYPAQMIWLQLDPIFKRSYTDTARLDPMSKRSQCVALEMAAPNGSKWDSHPWEICEPPLRAETQKVGGACKKCMAPPPFVSWLMAVH